MKENTILIGLKQSYKFRLPNTNHIDQTVSGKTYEIIELFGWYAAGVWKLA